MQYRTAAEWKVSFGPNPGGSSQLEKLSVDIYDAVSNPSISAGKADLQYNEMPITVDGGTDSIDFAPYAGKIIVGVVGIKESTNTVEYIGNAAGFAVTAATIYDRMYLKNGVVQPIVIADFNLLLPFTGVGTTASWNTGTYDAVVILYTDGATSGNSTLPMVRFTTEAGVYDYTDVKIGLMNGVVPALVLLGNQVLTPVVDFTITGDTITLDSEIVVADGDTLLIIPFN